MIYTENLRRQHDELVAVVKKITVLINVDITEESAKEVRSLLSKLGGKLSVHLSAEDNVIYPQMCNHKDIKVRELANKYIKEMGNIKEVFAVYSKKWSSYSDIYKLAPDFKKESLELFSVLAKRIEKENKELYDFVDSLQK